MKSGFGKGSGSPFRLHEEFWQPPSTFLAAIRKVDIVGDILFLAVTNDQHVPR